MVATIVKYATNVILFSITHGTRTHDTLTHSTHSQHSLTAHTRSQHTLTAHMHTLTAHTHTHTRARARVYLLESDDDAVAARVAEGVDHTTRRVLVVLPGGHVGKQPLEPSQEHACVRSCGGGGDGNKEIKLGHGGEMRTKQSRTAVATTTTKATTK